MNISKYPVIPMDLIGTKEQIAYTFHLSKEEIEKIKRENPEVKIAYICDHRKECRNDCESGFSECKHTLDKRNALFEKCPQHSFVKLEENKLFETEI